MASCEAGHAGERRRARCRERPACSAANRPALPPGKLRASSHAQREGRKRLEARSVIRIDRIVAGPEPAPDGVRRPRRWRGSPPASRTRGQLQPIRVRWDDARPLRRRGRGAAVAGGPARRASSRSRASWSTGRPTAEDLLEDQLVENALREDLKPIEQARAFEPAHGEPGPVDPPARRRLQVSAGSVTKALALLELPDPVQEDVDAGRIAPATAYELSKVEDPDEQAELAKEAARGRLRRDELKDLIGKPQQGGAPGRARRRQRRSRPASSARRPGRGSPSSWAAAWTSARPWPRSRRSPAGCATSWTTGTRPPPERPATDALPMRRSAARSWCPPPDRRQGRLVGSQRGRARPSSSAARTSISAQIAPASSDSPPAWIRARGGHGGGLHGLAARSPAGPRPLGRHHWPCGIPTRPARAARSRAGPGPRSRSRRAASGAPRGDA